MALQANELRIGNLIQSKSDVPSVFTVKGIHAGDYIDVGYRKLLKYEEFQPIAITTEWLQKMGFEKYYDEGDKYSAGYKIKTNDNDWFKLRYQRSQNEIHSFGISYADDGDNLYNFSWHIKYVHSLQNLFYCLTGKELEIK